MSAANVAATVVFGLLFIWAALSIPLGSEENRGANVLWAIIFAGPLAYNIARLLGAHP